MRPVSAAELVIEQTRLLESVALEIGARVGHIKLHGALYNMASRDPVLAAAIAGAVSATTRESGSGWVLVALAGSELYTIAKSVGLRVSGEAFADRTYRSDGTLTPRSEPGSVITDLGAATRQAVRLAKEGLVRTTDGADIEVAADTLCLHGDGPNAVSFARQIRDGLELAGVDVRH